MDVKIDGMLGEHGGTRMCTRGFADAATSDIFSDFDSWTESLLWPSITKHFGSSQVEGITRKSGLQVKVSTDRRASILGHQIREGVVLETKQLTSPGIPVKQHIKFRLPDDMTYHCGDYLAILPINPQAVVHKTLRWFNLPHDAILEIHNLQQANVSSSIPLDMPVSAFDILSSYVELSQPACKRDLKMFLEASKDHAETYSALKALVDKDDVNTDRTSPLDLLIKYPAIEVSIGDFLTMLPPMRMRQYSISSSPLLHPLECTITFSVVNTPLTTNSKDITERYLGVASNYLSNLNTGDKVHMTVKPSQSGFKPPVDPDIPIIMACAGSGLAPFRGFIMERVEKTEARRMSATETSQFTPAKAILYVGCRTKDMDDIYAEELAEWQNRGAVDVRWAYSRPTAHDGTEQEYVQDRIMKDHNELVALFEQGASLFICGSVAIGNAVRNSIKSAYLEERRRRLEKGTWKGKPPIDGESEDDVANEWLGMLRAKHRLATDVFT